MGRKRMFVAFLALKVIKRVRKVKTIKNDFDYLTAAELPFMWPYQLHKTKKCCISLQIKGLTQLSRNNFRLTPAYCFKYPAVYAL